jgi:undecaprenyl diphosphate synthase
MPFEHPFNTARRAAGASHKPHAADPECLTRAPRKSRTTPARTAVPRHIGFIPDGNRRWAVQRGLRKECGYSHGIAPGVELLRLCAAAGIAEVSIFGFTKDNVRRAAVQRRSFSAACVQFAHEALAAGARLQVVGDAASRVFPAALRNLPPGRARGMRVNLLVNYDWRWDLDGLRDGAIRSVAVPAIDLVVRWGGRCRLSGFLPVQSVYADFFCVPEYWPDFRRQHFADALAWFKRQDRTLGG